MSAIGEVSVERERQIAKGFDAAHDDEHDDGELAQEAARVLNSLQFVGTRDNWGIVKKWQNNKRKLLVIAAALVVAEIERLDRLADRERVEAVAAMGRGLDPAARKEFGEFERLVLLRAMRKCGLTELPAVSGNGFGERASGDCICSVCDQRFLDHPPDWRMIGFGNVPFLNILCDGRRVKL